MFLNFLKTNKNVILFRVLNKADRVLFSINRQDIHNGFFMSMALILNKDLNK